jgi:hypothetical protein
MRKLFIVYALFWVAVSLVYLMSCFDGVYSERLYSIVETVTFPWGSITSKWGIAFETKHGFSLFVLLFRYLLEVVAPAVLDFGIIYTIYRFVRKASHRRADPASPPTR